jgi:tetratricopeptide (TPR) repeat protein
MSARRRVTLVFAGLVLVCLLGQAAVVRKLDALRPAATLEDVLYIPSPQVLKRLSLGYDGLIADVYWTRAVQYFGRKHIARAGRYNLLFPLLDITTTLDPKMVPAYEFGATFLAQRPPEGAGQPDKAVELLQKGIQANPNEWRLPYDLGFVYYFEFKDYKEAAAALTRAADMPGAPPLHAIAGYMAQHGGELETARRLWTITYETAQQENVKKNAERHLVAIDSDAFVTVLEQAVANFRQRFGRAPASWAELGAAGYGRGVPRDPTGRPYRLVDGRVEVADPDKLPFIVKGLPSGYQPSIGPVPDVQ